jgi:hypothetical protein
MTHFEQEYERLILDMDRWGVLVNTGEWQAQQGTRFDHTIERTDVEFTYWPGTDDLDRLQRDIQPNLPWAEEHFQERISGEPHNPPPSHKIWPFAKRSNEEHLDGHKFSHTYPERFWPIFANTGGKTVEGRQAFVPRTGIRFEYGDLGHLLRTLHARPHTRQAYLPIWFPEDLNASNRNERVPCTLGYHFMIRGGLLSCRYYMRSCDLFRHFRDDVYMAARLMQFIVEQLNQERMIDAGCQKEGVGKFLELGHLKMYIASLHIFEDEVEVLRQKARQIKEKSLYEAL